MSASRALTRLAIASPKTNGQPGLFYPGEAIQALPQFQPCAPRLFGTTRGEYSSAEFGNIQDSAMRTNAL